MKVSFAKEIYIYHIENICSLKLYVAMNTILSSLAKLYMQAKKT